MMKPVMTELVLFSQNAVSTGFRLSFLGWDCGAKTAPSTLLRTICYSIREHQLLHIKLVIGSILLEQFEETVFRLFLLLGSELQLLIHREK